MSQHINWVDAANRIRPHVISSSQPADSLSLLSPRLALTCVSKSFLMPLARRAHMGRAAVASQVSLFTGSWGLRREPVGEFLLIWSGELGVCGFRGFYWNALPGVHHLGLGDEEPSHPKSEPNKTSGQAQIRELSLLGLRISSIYMGLAGSPCPPLSSRSSEFCFLRHELSLFETAHVAFTTFHSVTSWLSLSRYFPLELFPGNCPAVLVVCPARTATRTQSPSH